MPDPADPDPADPDPADPDPADPDQGDVVDDLDRVDRALIGLRHLWSGPLTVDDPALGAVEMSTIWIVDALSRAPRGSEVTIGDLAQAIDVAHSTASRLVDRAQASDAITRTPSAGDARKVTIDLTDAGWLLAQTARDFRTGYLNAAMADWTAADRTRFADLLTRFAAATTDPQPEPRAKDHP